MLLVVDVALGDENSKGEFKKEISGVFGVDGRWLLVISLLLLLFGGDVGVK